MIIRYASPLCKLLDAEAWINSMAQQGYRLVRVHKSDYEFEQYSIEKTKNLHYCFEYYWKGKKDQYWNRSRLQFSNARRVEISRFTAERYSDLIINILEYHSNNKGYTDDFFHFHHNDYHRALKHTCLIRILIISMILIWVLMLEKYF